MIGYLNAPGSSPAGRRIAAAGMAFQARLAAAEAAAALPLAPSEPEPTTIDSRPAWRRPTVVALPGIVPRWLKIMREVAAEFGIDVDDIRGRSRKHKLAAARQAVMYRLRVDEGWTVPQIANRLQRDHTTIPAGIEHHCRKNGLPYPSRRGE